jgi:hypothetical protein
MGTGGGCVAVGNMGVLPPRCPARSQDTVGSMPPSITAGISWDIYYARSGSEKCELIRIELTTSMYTSGQFDVFKGIVCDCLSHKSIVLCDTNSGAYICNVLLPKYLEV